MSRNDFGNKPKAATTSAGGGVPRRSPEARSPMPERVASFGGLPGKAQPKDRSGGVTKVKTRPQDKGL